MCVAEGHAGPVKDVKWVTDPGKLINIGIYL